MRSTFVLLLLAACATSRAPEWHLPPSDEPLHVGFATRVIASPDPERAAGFHARVLGLPSRAEDGGFRVGEGDHSLRVESGPPSRVLRITVRDLDPLLVALSVRGVAFELRADGEVVYEDPDGRPVIVAELRDDR